MIILIAPDSFNNHLNATKAAHVMAKAWQKANPDDTVLTFPLKINEDSIVDSIEFDAALEKADIILTGKNKLEAKTVSEKILYRVARKAKKINKPVIAFAIQVSIESMDLFDAVFSIVNQPMSLRDVEIQAANLLENSVYQVASLYKNMAQSTIEIMQSKAGMAQKWIFINTALILNEGQTFRLLLERTIKAGGMIVLYGTYPKQIYKTFFKEIESSCPFIVEYGGGIYIPKSATTLYFDDMEQNDKYFYQHLGISTFMIQRIVDKLAKISGINLEILPSSQPTKFSITYKLINSKVSLNLLQNLLQQQGLDSIQKADQLWIGQQKLSTAIEGLLEILSTKQTNITTYGIGVTAIDRPILEQVNEPYLIKQVDGWLPLQLPMLNMINQEGIKGVGLVFEEILKET